MSEMEDTDFQLPGTGSEEGKRRDSFMQAGSVLSEDGRLEAEEVTEGSVKKTRL